MHVIIAAILTWDDLLGSFSTSPAPGQAFETAPQLTFQVGAHFPIVPNLLFGGNAFFLQAKEFDTAFFIIIADFSKQLTLAYQPGDKAGLDSVNCCECLKSLS